MKSASKIFSDMRDRAYRQGDRMFFWLLIGQWIFSILLALAIAPYSYDGNDRSLHFHVKAAIVFGALLNTMPLLLIKFRPGSSVTRHVIAGSQMMWSALLIMITGGRIETHFHVFGSLAFLAFYRDWTILVSATFVVAGDHLARGLWWPQSVYALDNPEWWRFLEHAGWVTFEVAVLTFACKRGVAEMHAAAEREALLERTNDLIADEVQARTRDLEVSMNRYRSLVENIDAVPFEYDTAHYRVLYVAPQAARLLECEPHELNDGFFPNVLHPDDRAHVRGELRAFAEGTRSGHEPIDFRMIAKTGRVVDGRCFLSDRCDDRRRVRGIMLDVTRQKKLEHELREAQKLESVGRLAAGVAHEINTPIQYVADSVQFARDAIGELCLVTDKLQESNKRLIAGEPSTSLADEARRAADAADLGYLLSELPQALDRALDGTERVASIVRSMKVFAHPDRERVAPADLNDALKTALTVARNEYKYVADVELACEALPPVMCSAGEINQVFLNIIVNAAHAIGDRNTGGEQRGTITVRTRRDGDDVVVSIGDTGAGIPAAVHDRIFDPFFTTKPVGKGTGQGLAISRSIVDKHGGALWFDTTLGTGTTFHIKLPIAARNAAKDAA